MVSLLIYMKLHLVIHKSEGARKDWKLVERMGEPFFMIYSLGDENKLEENTISKTTKKEG